MSGRCGDCSSVDVLYGGRGDLGLVCLHPEASRALDHGQREVDHVLRVVRLVDTTPQQPIQQSPMVSTLYTRYCVRQRVVRAEHDVEHGHHVLRRYGRRRWT